MRKHRGCGLHDGAHPEACRPRSLPEKVGQSRLPLLDESERKMPAMSGFYFPGDRQRERLGLA
jgi:hypothetical protein